MMYLIIDACLSGTGIRDYYEGGYILPIDLGLRGDTIQLLDEWLSKYEDEHYNGYTNSELLDELDREGKEIAALIKNELIDVKIEYFSDARMTKEII